MNGFKKERTDAKKEIQAVFDQIKAPEDLKADTLRKMQKESKDTGRKQKMQGKKRRPVLAGAAGIAAVCAASLLIFLVNDQQGSVIITPLKEGAFCQDVELKDGALHFVRQNMEISLGVDAGLGYGGIQEEASEEEAPPADGGETKDLQNGRIDRTKLSEFNWQQISPEDWSYIGEQKIYITVAAREDEFEAVYEQEGTIWKIEGRGVTQEEFIKYLYQTVKK